MNRIIKSVQLFNFGLVILLAFSAIFWSRLYLPESLTFIGRLHPIVLHLPIGLFFICLVLLPLKKYIEGKSGDELQHLLLELTTGFALLSAQVGLLLAREDGYSLDDIADHKNAALVFSIGLFLFTAFYRSVKPLFHRIGLGLLGIILVFTGHNGAVITHGEDFLFPTTQDNQLALLDPSTASVYEWAIAPIIKKKCQTCHNERKSKGGLLLLDSLTMLRGGENGAVVVKGNSAESKIIQFTELPMDDDNHMPPSGKPQMTPQEIQLLKYWIDDGLSFSKKLRDLDSGQPFAQALNQIINKKTSPSYTFDAANPDLIERTAGPFLSIRPLAAGSPALDVSFHVASAFDNNRLNNLLELKVQIVNLSLINMPVTDDDLGTIAGLENLERLNLNGTGVTTDGLNDLSRLSNLKSLSLVGTSIELPEQGFFNQWPELQQVFLADTKIAFQDIEKIKSQYPQLAVHSIPPSDELSALRPPKIIGDQTIFSNDETIAFAQLIAGAEIKYTKDGTVPDSLNGIIYTEPFTISKGLDLNVITQKEGWATSPVATYHVYTRGAVPSEVNQSTSPNAKYPGQGPTTLIDGAKASVNNLVDPRWMGFLEEKYIAQFSFEEAKPITQISFAYGLQVPAYVFPPTAITVLGGNSTNSMKHLFTKKLDLITPQQADLIKNEVYHIPLDGEAFKYYKITAENLNRIPNWHPGKGQKGWLFIDEIFFYE